MARVKDIQIDEVSNEIRPIYKNLLKIMDHFLIKQKFLLIDQLYLNT